ncbi:sigma-54-dependent transcriptional regulator [Planctomicrobium sp. SH668]|uniref:sigma-54-dependent transcriptional regulator n=1 Tax=Planctomicrobium sp. SH668 TaxID=3448126 RepID=UPI003F5C1260
MSSTTPATIRPHGKVVACAKSEASRQHLELAIRRAGYDCVSVATLAEVRVLVMNDLIAATVIDEPESVAEVELLDSEARRGERPTQFILLPSIGTRLASPRSATCEVLDPPLTPERIGRALFSAVARAQLITENIQLRQKLEGRMFDGLIGVSDATRELRSAIHAAAEHDLPVLVSGESGSGKSEVARAIHLTRSGPGQPLLAIRCSLLTSSVVERELFGDEGSEGRFAAAAAGTLVFEEIEALTIAQQHQLAEIILNNAFPNGDNYVPLRARVIATSSADLRELCQQDKFSHQLLRILDRNTVTIKSLRHRMEDLPVLAEHFLQQSSVKEGTTIRRLSEGALQQLLSYNWPGNVRELENVISRCCSLTTTPELNAEEIQPWLDHNEESTELPGLTLREMERKLIEATFTRFGGNRELTAKALQIGIRTLSGKLREYGYPPRGGPGSNRIQERAA